MGRYTRRLRLPRVRLSTVILFTVLFYFFGRSLHRLFSPVLPHSLRAASPSEVQSDFETPPTLDCEQRRYTTELISLDPLLIYIEGFLSGPEITELLEAGEAGFSPSVVIKNGLRQDTPDRTSTSAALPRANPTVQCVLSRAESFLGTLFSPETDDIGPPQLVRYKVGEKYSTHYDWYKTPQPTRRGMAGKGRSWNRMASFLAFLEDHCEGGETWFPQIDMTHSRLETHEHEHLWRVHEEGGTAFRPIAGNALFWVNLHANGTGDERTIHAGLPVEKGTKTAMNIWPRKFYS